MRSLYRPASTAITLPTVVSLMSLGRMRASRWHSSASDFLWWDLCLGIVARGSSLTSASKLEPTPEASAAAAEAATAAAARGWALMASRRGATFSLRCFWQDRLTAFLRLAKSSARLYTALLCSGARKFSET